MTSEKLISRERYQKSPTYEDVAKLFLESEFQRKGNKQTIRRKFSARIYTWSIVILIVHQ